MQSIYETLATRGFGLSDLPKALSKLTVESFYDLVHAVQNTLQAKNRDIVSVPNSLFNFIATDAIGGGSSPCEAAECRLERASSLRRFAALYADRVLIRNPFERYIETFKIEKIDDRIRNLILGDLLLLWSYKPIIEKGIVEIAQEEHHFCRACFAKYSSSALFNYEDRLDLAARSLLATIKKQLRVFAVSDGRILHLEVEGHPEIIEHKVQIINFVYYIPKPIEKYVKKPGRHLLSSKEMRSIGIVENIMADYLDDFAMQDWYTNNFDYTYLSNRSIDLQILSQVNQETDAKIGILLTEGLRHTLPEILNVPIGTLLKLRSTQKEVFDNYRNSLNAAVRERNVKNQKDVKQLFLDTVRPSIERINLEIRNAKSSALRKLLADAIIYSGLVTVGLFSGLLPSNVSQIVGLLGGIGFGHSILTKAAPAILKPDTIRKNPYFFLWKASELGKKTQKESA